MPSVRASEIIGDAFALLGVYAPTEAVRPQDAQAALRTLNDMLSEWSTRTAFIPTVARERFALVVGQGGPYTPYTIGDGGDFDTARPPTQDSIHAANLILTTTDPEVRVPLGIYTDDAYFANQLPGMSNPQPTALYYNPTYADGLGSIFLWPVPTVAYNELELQSDQPVAEFPALTTLVDVPSGLPRVLKYNLADALQAIYALQLAPAAQRIAVSSLESFKRANHKLTDLLNDAAMIGSSRNGYNINTDGGGN